MSKNLFLGLLAAFFFFGSAHAFAPSPTTTTSNRTTFNPSPVTRTSGVTFGTSSNGDIIVGYSGQQRMPVPGGGSIPIDVTGKIPKSTAAAAFGRFASKAFPVFSTASAAYALMQELGYSFNGSQWFKEITGENEGIEYQITTYLAQGDWSPSLSSAFSSAINNSNIRARIEFSCGGSAYVQLGGANTTSQTYTSTTYWCDVSENNTQSVGPARVTNTHVAGLTTRTAVITVPGEDLITREEAIEEILSRDGWPTTSKFADAVKESIESGETAQVDSVSVAGPASSPNSVAQKAGTQQNSTATETKTNNHTYTGNTVNTSIVTTVVTVNNTTGEVLDTTTTTDQPPVEETPFEMPCGVGGSPPCNVKVDESGTPSPASAGNSQDGGGGKIDDEKLKAENFFNKILTEAQLEGWTFSFQLPTGCAPYPLGEAYGLSIDICQFQPMIHDLMSMLWISAGIWGLLGLLRSALGA